jgi:diguanylate cyclase (GGDEF)-like protein/PAS domain S-box-containing protein
MDVSREPLAETSTGVPARVGAPPALTLLARALAVFAGYYLAARLGLLIPYVGTHISLVWLPTGIAVAGYRRWGAAMAPAVFLAGMAANASIGGPLWVAAGVGAGSAAGTWLAAALLGRWGFDDRMLRRQDMGLLLLAVGIGMLVTSANGVAWLRLGDTPDTADLAMAWLSWFFGDAAGALLAAIPLIALTGDGARRTFLGRAGLVNSGLLAVVLGCGLLLFSGALGPNSPLLFPLLALPFFLSAVLGLRGGVLASSTGVLLLSTAAAYGTAAGQGPFAHHDPHAGVLALWSYITAQACTSLLICGLGTELQSSRRQFSALMHHADDAILLFDAEGVLTVVNRAARAMLGLDERIVGRPLGAIPRGNGARLAALLEEGSSFAARELVLAGEDGARLHVECQMARYLDASGRWQTHMDLRDVSRRKEAEARLATSEARLKALTDNLPALFAYVDHDQVYRFANAHFRRMMDVEPGQVVGQTMRQFLGTQAHEALRPHIEAALRGERQQFERSGWGRNAGMHYLIDYVPEIGPAGEVPGFFIMVLDISRRREAEVALARSEDRLRTVTDNMPALISHIGPDYRYNFANAHYLDWFGLPESPVGKTVAQVFGEKAFASVRERMDQALRGEDVAFELVDTIREGAHLQVHYLPDRDGEGRVIGIYGLVMDRTEQHRAQERAEASQRQLRAVADNLPVLITYVDSGERLRYMNATFRDWLGVDPDTALDRPLAEVIGPRHYGQRRAALRAALAGRRVEFEIVSQTLVGPRNLQEVFVPDMREDGAVHGVFTLSTDVTALKTVEARLQLLARLDPLTGLPNRRQFDELLDQALARCDRGGRPMALMYLDVDHFKAINDGRGHAAGDEVLKEFAARLHGAIRATDAAARIAGDEFVVILEGLSDIDQARAVAAKVVDAVRAPMCIAGEPLAITTSMGVAFRFPHADATGPKELVARADRALYQAKAAGRDGFRVDPG